MLSNIGCKELYQPKEGIIPRYMLKLWYGFPIEEDSIVLDDVVYDAKDILRQYPVLRDDLYTANPEDLD